MQAKTVLIAFVLIAVICATGCINKPLWNTTNVTGTVTVTPSLTPTTTVIETTLPPTTIETVTPTPTATPIDTLTPIPTSTQIEIPRYDFSCSPTIVKPGDVVHCTELSGSRNITSWTWYFGDGATKYTNGGSIDYTFNSSGSFFVYLRVVTSNPTTITVVRKEKYVTVTGTIPTTTIPTTIVTVNPTVGVTLIPAFDPSTPTKTMIEVIEYQGDVLLGRHVFYANGTGTEFEDSMEFTKNPLSDRYEIVIYDSFAVDNESGIESV